MSNRSNKIGIEARIPEKSRNALNLASWRRQDSGSSTETERTTPQPSGLETWIKKLDDEKAATGSRTPSILSAFSRVTYTAAPAARSFAGSTATIPQAWPTLPALSAEDPKVPKPSARLPSTSDSSSATSVHVLGHRQTAPPSHPGPSISQLKGAFGVGINYQPNFSSPPSETKASPRPLAPFSSYAPPNVDFAVSQISVSKPLPPSLNQRQKAHPRSLAASQSQTKRTAPSTISSAPYPSPFTAFFPLENKQPSSGFAPPAHPPSTIEQIPSGSWNSSSLTRDWTPGQVLLGYSRIFTELNFDFYNDNHLKINFDGDPKDVSKVWADIKLAYSAFLKSYELGMNMLTFLTQHGNSDEEVKSVLANAICFLSAGKVGLGGRAEEFARALVSRGKLLRRMTGRGAELIWMAGDIVCFVERRCLESELVYPGGSGETEQRLSMARH